MTRWKEYSLVILLTLCLFSAGCSPPAPEPEESQPESSSAVSETSSHEEPVSSQREYLPRKEDYTSEFDFETIYALCSDALVEYHNALFTAYKTGEKTKVDFSKYIENPDLIAYMEKQLELGIQYQGSYTYREFDEFGLYEYDISPKCSGDNHDLVYLQLGGVGMQFLVENTGERFVIAEWFNGVKDSLDTICRGGSLRQIKDEPLYWDDYDPEELQKAIDERIEYFASGPIDPVK